MFRDKRSRKVVFMAHCILNQNSISDGTATHPAQIKDMVKVCLDNDIGIVQMPCPEMICLGLDRGNENGIESDVVVENTRIRKELLSEEKYEKLLYLAAQTVFQIEDYYKHGFQVLGIIGIDRSPSCGVNTTSENNLEVEGTGLFIQAIRSELINKGIGLPVYGIKGGDFGAVKELLSNQRLGEQ